MRPLCANNSNPLSWDDEPFCDEDIIMFWEGYIMLAMTRAATTFRRYQKRIKHDGYTNMEEFPRNLVLEDEISAPFVSSWSSGLSNSRWAVQHASHLKEHLRIYTIWKEIVSKVSKSVRGFKQQATGSYKVLNVCRKKFFSMSPWISRSDKIMPKAERSPRHLQQPLNSKSMYSHPKWFLILQIFAWEGAEYELKSIGWGSEDWRFDMRCSATRRILILQYTGSDP